MQNLKQLKQGSDSWHAAREGRLTGSVFAAAIGISPYLTRPELWRQMTGRSPKFEGNEATDYGTLHEADARFAYECETGRVVEETGFWVGPESWLGCSPDGMVGDLGLVEFKCPFSGQAHKEVPAHYMAQIQGQLAITGCAWCDFVSWTPTEMNIIRVREDPDYWAWMLPMLRDFWACVLFDREPPRLKAKPVYQPRKE